MSDSFSRCDSESNNEDISLVHNFGQIGQMSDLFTRSNSERNEEEFLCS